MKKIYITLFALLSATFTFAGGNSGNAATRVTSDKPIISNGFYLLGSIGFPKVNYGSSPQSLGIQPSLEFGSKFLFLKNEKIGLGMNVSWLMLGYNSEDLVLNMKMHYIPLQFLKFGPLLTVGLNDDIAVDAYIDVIPVNLNASIDDQASAVNFMGGFFSTFAPGVKFRYKILSLGAELQFGTIKELDSNSLKLSANYLNPRLLLGFKF